MSEIIITQTVSPKNYCKYERTMCEFANDRGYCVKTGCTKRIIINEVPKVNKDLVEVVRCKDCKHYDGRPCGKVDWYNSADDFCSRAERRTDGSNVQDK